VATVSLVASWVRREGDAWRPMVPALCGSKLSARMEMSYEDPRIDACELGRGRAHMPSRHRASRVLSPRQCEGGGLRLCAVPLAIGLITALYAA
jgi:hypothetical protein